VPFSSGETVELRVTRQINGDLRIDDAEDDAPMLKIEFFNEWATTLTDDEKEDIMEAVIERLSDVFRARND
jgi:hypothetical protein